MTSRIAAALMAFLISACTLSGSIDTLEGEGEGDGSDAGTGAKDTTPATTTDTSSGASDTKVSGGKDTATPGTDTSVPPSPDTAPPPPAPDTAPPPTDTTPPDPTDIYSATRVLCVDEINRYRATEGKPPYAGWTAAHACSDAEAKSDSETGTAHGAFGKCGERAQNECPGWPGPPDSMITGCLKMMWDEGPGTPFSAHGHYINMSSTSYTAVACGFYKTPTGKYWSVQNFK
jgi:hypothetical protein